MGNRFFVCNVKISEAAYRADTVKFSCIGEGGGILKDFLKIWTKRNSTARKLLYIGLVGNTSDLYGGKVEKDEVHSLLMAAPSPSVRRKEF